MRSLMMLITALLLALPIRADVLNVPADFSTIQAAMDAAQDGDEIVLAAGTYNVASPLSTITTNPSRVLEAFTLRSADPSDPVTVAATRIHAASLSWLFEGVDQLELAGITLSGDGCDELAGSINDSLTIRNCVIDGGNANDQFAIESLSGSLRLIDSHITGQVGRFNDADGEVVEVDGCTFGPRTGNYELFYLNPIELRLSNMSFADVGEFDDGGVLWPIAFDLVMTNMTFVRASAPPSSRRSAELYNCRFEDVPVGSSGFFDVDAFVAEDTEFIGLTGPFGPESVVVADSVTMRHSGVERCGGFAVVLARETGRFEDSDFIDNTARYATIDALGAVTIDRCRFIGNNTVGDPQFDITATISLREAADTASAVRESDFLGNGIGSGGSTLIECPLSPGYSPDGSLTVERCTFAGNRARVLKSPLNGPDNIPFATFTDSAFVGNESSNLGFGNAVFLGCTFANNGNGSGSAWSFFGDSGKVVNCIVDHDDPQTFSGTVAVCSSVLSESIPGATNTTSLAPLFIRPPSDGGDGWGDDPATPADESLNDDFGDLRLQPASPAIDAGTNDLLMPGDVDLDGNPRLADDPGIPGANVDIGAYEFQGASCLADVNQDGVVTPADYNAWILAFNDGSPLADQNRTGDITPADYNAWILNFNATFSAGCP